MCSDLGHNDVGTGFLNGNKRAITPNLDALVGSGVELTQFYTFKYCAPSRGALMSGRYPFHFGFFNNQDANDYGLPANFTTLPAFLSANAGFATHMIGKWCVPLIQRASAAFFRRTPQSLPFSDT